MAHGEVCFIHILFADDFGVAHKLGIAIQRGVVLRQYSTLGIDHRNGEGRRIFCFFLIDAFDDILDNPEIGKIHPNTDFLAVYIVGRGRERDGKPILLRINLCHYRHILRLFDHGAGETIGLQKFSGHGFFEPARFLKILAIQRFGIDRLTLGVDRVDPRHTSIPIDQHHQFIGAVILHVAVHRLHEGRLFIVRVPVFGVAAGKVADKCLHIAVTLKHHPINDLARIGSRRLHGDQ